MSNQFSTLSLGTAARYSALFFATSTNYTVPLAGVYRRSLLAPSGSGAAIFVTTTGGAASAGGGGEFCEDTVFIPAGTVLAIVTGTPGASVTSSVSGTGANGNDATNASVTATGLATLTCVGGKKGVFTTTNAAVATGGLGGTGGTGGDYRTPGGLGGDATHTTNAMNSAGGGAAGSPYGPGGKGGASACSVKGAAGGGAIGGFDGGAASGTTASGGGAGTGSVGLPGSSSDGISGLNKLASYSNSSADGLYRTVVQSASFVAGQLAAGSFESINDPFRALTGGGETGGSPGGLASQGHMNGGPGAGGRGLFTGTSRPGILGGAGGIANASAVTGTAPYFGGGSGGASTNTTGPAISATGGLGIFVLERVS